MPDGDRVAVLAQLANSQCTKQTKRVTMTINERICTNVATEPISSALLANSREAAQNIADLFSRCKDDNLREGLFYVDNRQKVTYWNRTAEMITGIRSKQMLDQKWTPNLIDLRDRYGTLIKNNQCPVDIAMRTSEPTLVAASVTGRGGRKVAIDIHAIPVLDHEGQLYGAVVLFHDLSTQVDLEQQVLTLYAHATRDQLTGLANRTHFERTLAARVAEVQESGVNCSLIVTDIDFFKTINDDFGHHIGDQALMSFAKLVQQNTQVDDVVGRFGGEEFMVLCPEQDIDQAASRAEEIRKVLESTPLAVLNGKCLTASFGVSQINNTDSATSAFVKADQALLKAKETGRNKVVVYGNESSTTSSSAATPPLEDVSFNANWNLLKGTILACEELSTSSSIDMVLEKVKGFVVDFKAEIVTAQDQHLQMRIDKLPHEKSRRWGDRVAQLIVDFELRSTQQVKSDVATLIRVTIRPRRLRDRRRNNLPDRAEAVMREIRGYLMISHRNETEQRTIRPTNPDARY